ncbi:MAG: TIGR03767 family metallophosphoesterase [Chloroflexi bacterium]|nr:TIGR03767 family metallophosphoesterase [Chloroflexota bacterium]
MHRAKLRPLLTCAVLIALSGIAFACRSGEPPPSGTTLEETLGVDGEGNFVAAQGEPYTVRTELIQAQSDRKNRRLSLVVFHQLSDFGIVDEESPLRSEWLEGCDSTVHDGAFRPQESLSLHVAEALIAQANVVDRSPVTRAPVDFAIHTGSAVDNAQFNELRWFLDLMDGVPVDPESGAVGYQGVQIESPAEAYSDLLALAQEAFIPAGLNYPWYAVAGNHDALSQGNFPITDGADQVATGAQKIFSLGPAAVAQACATGSIFGPGPSAELMNDPETTIRGVGADKNRRLLSRSEWIREHLKTETEPGPLGHGFTLEMAEEGRAYYSFEEGGVVFIVLDSANPTGFPSGSLDRAQYEWLESQLTAQSSIYSASDGQFVTTENTDRLIVIVSHHPSAVMTNPYPGADGSPRVLGEEVEELVGRYPNVILWLAGHTGRNSISAKPGAAGGGYWEVTTAGALDFPMQGRLVEIVDNRDGTLSIFTTMYDLATTVNPGDAEDGTPEDGLNQRLLAGVARQLAFRDPQLDLAGPGLAPSDRNAELLVPTPFDPVTLPPPTEIRF